MTHLSPEQLEVLARQGGEDAHLGTCAECRARLEDARGRVRLLSAMTRQTLSDLAFRRVEARLMEEVDRGLTPAWSPWRWMALGVGVVAAGLVAFTVSRPPPVPTAPPAAFPVAAQVPVVTPVELPALTVLRVPGATQVEVGGAWRAVRAGEVLADGAALTGGPVVLAASEAQALMVQGRVSLGKGATVRLDEGEVVAAVHGARTHVVGGALGLEAVDAVFSVARTAAETVVEVGQGELLAWDASGATAQRRTLKAPVRVRFAAGAALTQGAEEPPLGVTAPRVPRQPWAHVHAAGLPPGAALSMDGVALGTAPGDFLWEAGRQRLTVALPGKPPQVRFLDLVGGKDLTLAAAPPVPERTTEVEPDAEALARVMEDLRRQTPKLRACYEKWLKAHPDAEGEVVVSLTVSARGRVTRAAVQGEGLSPESAGCLARTAKTLVLPALGSEQELELPVRLKQAGR